jgi:hypothetical protein
MKVVSLLSQEVFVIPMVVSTILDTPLPSGVLPKSTPITPGSVAWITTVAMCPRSAIMKSNMVPPSAALRIDYLSIFWVGKCGRQERGLRGLSLRVFGTRP